MRSALVSPSRAWYNGTSLSTSRPLATLTAATHRTIFDVSALPYVRYQWVKTETDSAVVSAISFYGSALPRNVLSEYGLHPSKLENDAFTDEVWTPLATIAFSALPTTAKGSAFTGVVDARGLALIGVEMVVGTTITGFTIIQSGH